MTAAGPVLDLLTTPVNSATHWASLYVADETRVIVDVRPAGPARPSTPGDGLAPPSRIA
jgi:hypothetical protein